jgi:tetratricopeptide (TPR) repeat protein
MNSNNYHKEHKTLLEALLNYRQDLKVFKSYLNDKRLTHCEKTIIKSLIALKKNQHHSAYKILDSVSPPNDFVMAIYQYVYSLGLCNSGHFEEAIQRAQKSILAFESVKEKYYHFLPLNLLSLCFGNLKNLPQMSYWFDKVDAIILTDHLWIVAKMQTQAYLYLLQDKNEECLFVINSCLDQYPQETKNVRAHFLTIKFMTSFKLKRYQECKKIIEQYRNCQGSTIKENAKYMHVMLDHYLNDSPIYVYEYEFKSSMILFYQTQVIKELAVADQSQAIFWWKKLQKLNSKVYLDSFHYLGGHDLFSACLEKHRRNFQSTSKIVIKQIEPLSKEEQLKYILENADRPLSKEEIISLLWQEEMDEVNINRLKVLTHRLKKKYSLEIKSVRGSMKIHKAS